MKKIFAFWNPVSHSKSPLYAEYALNGLDKMVYGEIRLGMGWPLEDKFLELGKWAMLRSLKGG